MHWASGFFGRITLRATTTWKDRSMQATQNNIRIWITLVVAGWVGFAGCKKSEVDSEKSTATSQAASADSAHKVYIGVSLLTLTNPFFKDIADTLQAEGQKRGYEVVVTSGELDPAKQKDQVKDFLVHKASAIVLTPCDSKSIGTAIADANAAGVPVFTADVASTAEGVKVVSHCATDNLEGGRVAGRAMVELLGGKGKVAIIDHQEVESGMMREKGFLEEIAKAPGIEVVAKLPALGSRDRAFADAQDLLQSHPDVQAIFGVNDPIALGALAALEKAGKVGQIKIVGFDGQPEARQAVKDGKLYATVMQHPKEIASITIDSIARYMSGEEVPPVKLIPPALYRLEDAKKDPELK
jgi:ribose transport system substrate-binding protein